LLHRNIFTIIIYGGVHVNQFSWCVMLFTWWARKDLQRGDLSILSEVAKSGAWGAPNPARIERLDRRGFVAKKENDKLAVTLKGRAALWVRRHAK
jgi:hypothetical protein